MICNLGRNKEKGILSWEVRFKLAVGIAEALNYLHEESPRPVVHRDVKTSNILLTDELEPQVVRYNILIGCDFEYFSFIPN